MSNINKIRILESQDLDFQFHMSWSFFLLFNCLKREVVVCFVDIGGIVDHHSFKKKSYFSSQW
jgi:hypothetical protein